MKKSDKAINYFSNGFNCAQSVLTAFSKSIDIPEKDLLKISGGFGGGMGRLQEICGAVSGAYMVIGCKYGKTEFDDNEATEKTYSLVREFESEFKKLNISTNCKELLQCDLQTDEGKEYFKNHKLKERVCNKCVSDAVSIVERIL